MANMTRYNPFNEVVSLREAMDRLFEDSIISPRAGFVGTRGLAANLYETSDGFTLQVPMPGVHPEDVEITAQQSFTLPAPINSERAEAHYSDGILTLTLPKAEHAKARTVKVNAQ